MSFYKKNSIFGNNRDPWPPPHLDEIQKNSNYFFVKPSLTCNTGTSSQLVPASSSHWQIQSHPSISIARCITKIFSKLSLFKMTLLTVKSFSGSLFLPLPSAPQCWRSLELLFQISPLSRGSFKSLSCHLTNVNYNDFITTLLNIGCFYLFFLNERPFSIIQWNRDDVLKQNWPS